MSQFRQQMTEKVTGKVKKVPSVRPSKNIVAKFDEPYDFDRIKLAIHEFYPDNNGESAGSLARYVGRRISSTGEKLNLQSMPGEIKQHGHFLHNWRGGLSSRRKWTWFFDTPTFKLDWHPA